MKVLKKKKLIGCITNENRNVWLLLLLLQVVMLAMYNLSLEGTGRQGYFRWKEDICAFIGRHWNFLLGTRLVFFHFLVSCFDKSNVGLQ